jgi:hypothetical protein
MGASFEFFSMSPHYKSFDGFRKSFLDHLQYELLPDRLSDDPSDRPSPGRKSLNG